MYILCIYIRVCVVLICIYILIYIYIYICYINITNLWHRTSIHPSYGIFQIPGAVITGLWTTTLPKDEAILAHDALQVASACEPIGVFENLVKSYADSKLHVSIQHPKKSTYILFFLHGGMPIQGLTCQNRAAMPLVGSEL